MASRTRIAVVGVTTVLLTSTAACGSGGDQGSGDGPVELSYAIWNQDQAPALEELIADFEKANQGVEVSLQVTPFDQYFTKIQTGIRGDAGPDVFWLNAPNMPLYASEGAVMSLSDQLEGGEVDLGNYPEQLVELYTLEDEVYAVPRDIDTIGLWYNKQLFDEAGVEYPDESWTWEDVQEAARTITEKVKGVHGIASWLTNQQGYYNTIAQAGGHVVSEDGTESGFDDPGSIEGLRFWTEMIEEGSSPTHQAMTDTEPKVMFQSGKVAMFYGGSWQAVSLAETPKLGSSFDVARLPSGPESNTSIIHGLGNAINAGTDHPDEAWEFVEYLSSEEVATTMAESGIVVPAFEGTSQAWVDAFPDYDLQIFLDAVENATAYPVTSNTAEWQLLETEYLPPAWTGERPVDEAAQDLAGAMDAVLADQ